MTVIFATEEINLSEIQDSLKSEGAKTIPVLLNAKLRDKSKFSDHQNAFFICSEKSFITLAERTKQVRDLVGERVKITVCIPKLSIENRKSLIACGAEKVITPQSFSEAHIAERILAQIILDGDIKPVQCGSLIGGTKVMRDIYHHIEVLAPLNEPILIVGETGTGKELVATEFHSNSKRKSKFVCINFAEITPDLLPSELFGHTQGAFTNAIKTRKGLLAEAGDGTVFLDEIGELDLPSQAKLLRVLEEKKVRKVGSNDWEAISSRILAATNRNLQSECDEKRFRFDLYQRLKGFSIELLPLRDRKADIPLLVNHFIAEYKINYGLENLFVSDDFIDEMFCYDWQGNVRELRHLIRKASAYADSYNYISKIILTETNAIKTSTKNNSVEFDPLSENLKSFVQRAEKAYLKSALEKTNGNVSEASKLAGIERATFYKKLS